MATPIPFDTYAVNIDETETVYPVIREEPIMNLSVNNEFTNKRKITL